MQLVQEGWQGNTPQQGAVRLRFYAKELHNEPDFRACHLHMQSIYDKEWTFSFSIRDQIFVWGGQKAMENRTKHGVTFETTCTAFFDDLSV